MMVRANQLAMLVAAAAMWGATTTAPAADPPDLFLQHLADFVWTGAGGNGTWETPANWTAPTFPGGYPYPIPTYPNDPNRIDDGSVQANAVNIFPVVGANLSGGFGTDRTVNIANGNVTVASLKLGGTGTAVTTNLTASGANMLVFENAELNDTVTNPGNPNATPPLQPAPIWSFNQGRSLIWSTGTAGVGKENRISANIKLNDGVDVEGDRDLHIYGNIVEGVIDRDGLDTGFEENLESSINSLLSGGAKLFIHGNIVSQGLSETGTETSSDGPGGDRRFGINIVRGVPVPFNPQNPPDEVTRQGTVEIFGSITGDGLVGIGADAGNLLPLSTVVLHGDSSAFEGRIQVNRVNLVLNHNNALGGPTVDEDDDHKVKTGNPVQGFGFNFISTSDDRVIPAPIEVAQWQTVRGATSVPGIESYGDHSLTFSGEITQSNTRGWINILPTGKTLTFTGPMYPNIKAENPPGDGRAITFDGSGKTVIAGGIHDQVVTGDEDPNITNKKGYLRVRGSGSVVVDGRVFTNGVQTGFNDSDYTGLTFVEGSSLHFRGGQNDAFAGDDLPAGEIVSRGGAVGVDEGTRTNTDFLNKLRNSSNPYWNPASTPFFASWGNNEGVMTNYSTGGLMLGTVGTNEYSQDLDFTTGDLSRAANMSLAAHEGGNTYTGTITPSTTVHVNANTYQLGGGPGTLTLPNANQLTGARNLLVTNGGTVKLTNSNNYSGTTRILRKYLPSNTAQAEASERQAGGNDDGTVFGAVSTTLSVTNLANGGAASSIGNSSSAAANLVIQGGALKYEGAAASTDRLFTVGTSGATVDASGSGAVNFTNTAALEISVPAARSALISTSVPSGGNATVFGQPSFTGGNQDARRAFHTEDLTIGMRVYTSQLDFNTQTPPGSGVADPNASPVRITSITNREVMRAGQPDLQDSEADTNAASLPNAWPGYAAGGNVRTIQFGPAPARFLTLTGSNTGSNTLASLIGNAPVDPNAAPTTAKIAAEEAAAGYGSVGIIKQGLGKWVLTGNNTYSGDTDVEAGTLIVNGTQSGNGTTNVSSGATLGGGGTLPGALVNGGTVAPGATTTGTLTVKGNYNQGGTLAIELAGAGAGAYDALNVLPGINTGPEEGDYNQDGYVDAADFTVWRDRLGQTFNLPNEGGEVDTPGVVDQEDYDVWADNFGNANLSFGKATVSGSINIDLISNFTPTVGSMFTILTAGAGVTASNLTLTGESAGFSLIVNPTSLVLQYLGSGTGAIVAAVPEPTSVVAMGWILLVAGLRCRCKR